MCIDFLLYKLYVYIARPGFFSFKLPVRATQGKGRKYAGRTQSTRDHTCTLCGGVCKSRITTNLGVWSWRRLGNREGDYPISGLPGMDQWVSKGIH